MRGLHHILIILSLLSFSPLQAAESIPSFKTAPPEEITAFIDQLVKTRKASKSAVTQLVQALNDSEAPIPIKERAAWALGQMEIRTSVPTLIGAAQHKGLLVRSAALNALAKMRAKAALPAFIKIATSDPVLSLRQRATIALGLLRWEKTIEALVQLSMDQTVDVKGAAALAMAATHSKKNDFTQALKEMEQEESPYVKERAQRGLEVIKGNNKMIQGHLRSSDADIRLFAALYFHHHGKKADLAALESHRPSEADEDVSQELQAAIQAIKKRMAQAAQKEKARKEATSLEKNRAGTSHQKEKK